MTEKDKIELIDIIEEGITEIRTAIHIFRQKEKTNYLAVLLSCVEDAAYKQIREIRGSDEG